MKKLTSLDEIDTLTEKQKEQVVEDLGEFFKAQVEHKARTAIKKIGG